MPQVRPRVPVIPFRTADGVHVPSMIEGAVSWKSFNRRPRAA
jgi:hypothetical protein